MWFFLHVYINFSIFFPSIRLAVNDHSYWIFKIFCICYFLPFVYTQSCKCFLFYKGGRQRPFLLKFQISLYTCNLFMYTTTFMCTPTIIIVLRLSYFALCSICMCDFFHIYLFILICLCLSYGWFFLYFRYENCSSFGRSIGVAIAYIFQERNCQNIFPCWTVEVSMKGKI